MYYRQFCFSSSDSFSEPSDISSDFVPVDIEPTLCCDFGCLCLPHHQINCSWTNPGFIHYHPIEAHIDDILQSNYSKIATKMIPALNIIYDAVMQNSDAMKKWKNSMQELHQFTKKKLLKITKNTQGSWKFDLTPSLNNVHSWTRTKFNQLEEVYQNQRSIYIYNRNIIIRNSNLAQNRDNEQHQL